MLYEAESGEFEIALAGDCLITRRLDVFREERFLMLRDLWKTADAGFINLESGVVHRYLEGHHNLGGMYMTVEPHILDDLKWFGINMVSCANTHSFDYGEEGIETTIGYLDAAGITHAGTGRNLREARSPGYLDTARGRVALISCTAHVRPWAVAGEQRPDTSGRPGYSPLRWTTVYTVDQQTFDNVRQLGALLGDDGERAAAREGGSSTFDDTEAEYELFGLAFKVGDAVNANTLVHHGDMEEIAKQVREARRAADYVIVAMHCHERKFKERHEKPDFVREFAHRVLDEGADIFAGHGTQSLGVEIYRKKPIFYDLGRFIDQKETVRYLPAEAYSRYGLWHDATPSDFYDLRYPTEAGGSPSQALGWQQTFAKCVYAGGSLKEVRLYPVDLGHDRPISQRGRPVLADEESGPSILARIAQMSSRYGTDIQVTDGYGVINV